jgi:hypothetical protein
MATTNATNMTTLNYSIAVPTDQASTYASLFDQEGLMGSDSLTNAYELAGGGSDESDENSQSTNSSGGLSQKTLANGDIVIDDGTYSIEEGSSDDGSIKVTNDATGAVDLKYWGDPHLSNADGQTVGSAMGKNMDITLSDGTEIDVTPTAEAADGTSHIMSNTVTTKSGLSDTVTANQGSGQGFENGVSASGVGYNPNASDSDPSDAVNVYATSDGDLFAENNDTGAMTQLNSASPTNFDTATDVTGTVNASSDSGSSEISQLEALIQQLEAQQTQQQNELQSLLEGMSSGGSSFDGIGNSETTGLQSIEGLFDSGTSDSSQELALLAQMFSNSGAAAG